MSEKEFIFILKIENTLHDQYFSPMGKKKVLEKASPSYQNSSQQFESNSKKKSRGSSKKGSIKSRKNPAQTTSKQTKQKKERKCTGVPLGRPKDQDTSLTIIEDPTLEALNCLFLYLDSIGMKRGLVFKSEDRVKLNVETNSQIKWNENHQWNKQTQLEKITKNQKIYEIIVRFSESYGVSLSIEDIVDIFLNLSTFFADECTNELYTILSQVLDSIFYRQVIEDQIQRASKLYSRIVFFSGKFTKLRIRHRIQIHKSKYKKIQDKFINMFSDLVLQTRKCLREVDQIKKFLNQERAMQEQLSKIINGTNKSSKEVDQILDAIFS